MKKLLIAAALLGATATPALAAGNSASTSATASATVIAPVTISKIRDLSLGVIIQGAGSVTVDADAAGARSIATGYNVPTNSGNPTSAQFDVTAEAGYDYTFGVPASVTAGDLTIALTPSATTGNTATSTFYVGGSTTVSASTTTGSKSGTFTATVAYN